MSARISPFYAVLANTLVASVTNTFVWFAVTFWIYLETQSVITTAVMAGVYTATIALSGFFLGSLVDKYPKKTAMLLSSAITFTLFLLAFGIYTITPTSTFKDPTSVALWVFVVLALVGAIAGNLRTIALSTLVTILVPADRRDKANGLIGTTTGIAFLVASIFSGLVIGFLGVWWMLVIAIGLTLAVIAHLWTVVIPEPVRTAEEQERRDRIDIPGTIRAIGLVPGLFGLIFFQTFNNLIGGVFMSLMDAYGLSLVSVQVWGILFGVLTVSFIVGGLVVARFGLGPSPLRTLFLANIVMWSICIIFPIQASIVLLTICMFVWLCLIPAVEAAEQTILQKVVPQERQGRVFGFAQSVEQAASPVTAFVIGPVAQFIFIPFMTTGQGVELIGSWFGTGPDRGIALVFIVAGALGLTMTLLAMRTPAYRALSAFYRRPETPVAVPHRELQQVTS
jgi:DHA3 family multidrug efflux protein-like MFS transporter